MKTLIISFSFLFGLFIHVFSINNSEGIKLTKSDSIKSTSINNNDSIWVPRINLPDTINVAIGYTNQIFYRGIIESINPYNFNIKITGDVGGKQYPRYYEFTPRTEGVKTFIISIFDDSNKLINTKSCFINFLNVAQSPDKLKRILCIGDSLTANGVWTGELLRILSEKGGTPKGINLSNIELIGTVDKGSGNRFEAYGGKNWSWYVNETSTVDKDVKLVIDSHNLVNEDISSIWEDDNRNQWKLESIINESALLFSRVNHNNRLPLSGKLNSINRLNKLVLEFNSFSFWGANPFWNYKTKELDFTNYINENNFGNIDYVVILLTWNSVNKTINDLMINTQIFIDKLHIQFPNTKVLLCGLQVPSINGGLANNYGDANSVYGNYYDLLQYVFKLNNRYQKFANTKPYNEFVEFVNISARFDSENNMPESMKLVNSRSKKKEIIGTNGVHPKTEGYLQISDIIFCNINKLILQE